MILWQSVLACDGCLGWCIMSALLQAHKRPFVSSMRMPVYPASAECLYSQSAHVRTACTVACRREHRPSMHSMRTCEYSNAAPCEPLCVLAKQC